MKTKQPTYLQGSHFPFHRLFFVFVVCLALTASAAGPAIEQVRLPDGALQPSVAMGTDGTLHIIYFQGEDPAAGDVYYTRQARAGEPLATPIRVNSMPGNSVAVGTIRGPQIALGANNRVHVAWNASWRGHGWPEPPKKMDIHDLSVLFYTRLNDEGTGFEPQRDVMTRTFGLDGGGSVAADRKGNVWVVWGAVAEGAEPGETNRAIFVTRSSDGGATFAPETRANSQDTGACACCGLKAMADRDGDLLVAYRIADKKINRDSVLLRSEDGGSSFASTVLGTWKLAMCPTATYSLNEGKDMELAAWESERKVFFNRVDKPFAEPVAAPGYDEIQQKPSVTSDGHGHILLTWSIGSGWGTSRSLAWQLFDAEGKRLGDRTLLKNALVPWTLSAVATRPEGTFVIVW